MTKSNQFIKNKLNQIANNLKNNKTLQKEYHDFLKIKKIIIYLIDNNKQQELKPYINLTQSLYKLIIIKNNTSPENYNKEYSQFQSELKAKRKYFNKHIYVRPDDYDDIMIEVSKIFNLN